MCYYCQNSNSDPRREEATTTIPIIMVTSSDPVAAGLIDSLARPGGNITGLTNYPELSGKRLELLKEAVPGISLVGVLFYPTRSIGSAIAFKEYEVAARALKIPLQSLEVPRRQP